MTGQLQGKVAVITGGVDGMGLAGVRRFVDEGANVAILDIQAEKGHALAAEMGDAVRFVAGDIRKEADFQSVVDKAVDTWGGLDVFYHNAAVPGSQARIEDMVVADWDDLQAVLLRASLLAIKVSIAPMRARGGGSVILTSSVSAYNMKKSYPVGYVTAKGAVVYLARQAALQCASDRIRVNCLTPGGVATAIHLKRFGYSQEISDAMAPHMKALLFDRFQPLPYAGQAEDVAAAALFLASSESKWITGVDLPVDGGLSIERGITDADYEIARTEAEARARAELGVSAD